MALVIFYEKPGCGGNAKQKARLIQSGHQLDVRSLLSHPWTADELRSYFGRRPVADWFNRAAPKVRDGILDPDRLTEDQALDLMCADPLLIRRPLLEAQGRRECGFDEALIKDWLGLTEDARTVGEGCASAVPHAPCPTPPGQG